MHSYYYANCYYQIVLPGKSVASRPASPRWKRALLGFWACHPGHVNPTALLDDRSALRGSTGTQDALSLTPAQSSSGKTILAGVPWDVCGPVSFETRPWIKTRQFGKQLTWTIFCHFLGNSLNEFILSLVCFEDQIINERALEGVFGKCERRNLIPCDKS